MKVMAINGSPRKTWNTATLLKKALKGAASQGAETELVHLYDLNFKGCISCFACKTRGGKSYGTCAVKDDLRPILNRIARGRRPDFRLPDLFRYRLRRDAVLYGAFAVSLFRLYRAPPVAGPETDVDGIHLYDEYHRRDDAGLGLSATL